MDNWYFVEGVIVERMDGEGHVFVMNNDWAEAIRQCDSFQTLKPRGVPFDCMPEWAEKIHFEKGGDWDGGFWFTEPGQHTEITIYNHCPDEWKGKTFTITDNLKKLIFGGK